MQTVLALFRSYDDVDKALASLHKAGITTDMVGVIAREDVVAGREVGEGVDTDGVTEGATGGAMLGGLAGLIAGVAAMAIPGVGMIITAGTIATALGSTAIGAGIGAAAGGIIGGLVDLGLSEEEAQYYAEGIKRGGILLTATVPENRVEKVRSIYSETGAVDIDKQRVAWEQEGWKGFDPTMDPGDQYPRLP
jgi:uncharacterized membrane protein